VACRINRLRDESNLALSSNVIDQHTGVCVILTSFPHSALEKSKGTRFQQSNVDQDSLLTNLPKELSQSKPEIMLAKA
jgi:hypothetical protein